MQEKFYFNDVSLLITHYNRSRSLERLLNSFEKQNCYFNEIIVSDDCSNAEHREYLEKLRKLFDFKLITVPINGGLGQNINKGQDAVSSPFTLYVQEDFVAMDGCIEHLKNGRDLLVSESDLDTVRFYSYLDYPYKKNYKLGFSVLKFKLWASSLDRIPLYSDHPHLRRSTFAHKFGRYAEGKNPEHTEYDMMISFLKKKGKGLLFDNYKTVFDQVNTSTEPSTMKRKFWRYTDRFYLKMAVNSYRHLKFYWYYLFKVK